MCKKLPTCNAALVTNPCFVNGLHMKFRWILGGSYKLTITEMVSHIWRNCMERKTWNWWHSVILWLSRETGHATSAIRCRKGCKWQWRSCFNNRPPFQAPKNHFYIHILLERLWRSKTRRTVRRADTPPLATCTGRKKPRHKHCSIPSCCTTVATWGKGSLFGSSPPVLAGLNDTWITEPRMKASAETVFFPFCCIEILANVHVMLTKKPMI